MAIAHPMSEGYVSGHLINRFDLFQELGGDFCVLSFPFGFLASAKKPPNMIIVFSKAGLYTGLYLICIAGESHEDRNWFV